MIETILIATFISFLTRTLAIMINYSLSYGQLFGFIKLWMCEKILDLDVTIAFIEVTQTGNEEKSTFYYDQACEVKYNRTESMSKRALSYLFSLLDCVYCIGFWVSILVAFIAYFLGLDIYGVIVIPILTFFMIEKI